MAEGLTGVSAGRFISGKERICRGRDGQIEREEVDSWQRKVQGQRTFGYFFISLLQQKKLQKYLSVT